MPPSFVPFECRAGIGSSATLCPFRGIRTKHGLPKKPRAGVPDCNRDSRRARGELALAYSVRPSASRASGLRLSQPICRKGALGLDPTSRRPSLPCACSSQLIEIGLPQSVATAMRKQHSLCSEALISVRPSGHDWLQWEAIRMGRAHSCFNRRAQPVAQPML